MLPMLYLCKFGSNRQLNHEIHVTYTQESVTPNLELALFSEITDVTHKTSFNLTYLALL